MLTKTSRGRLILVAVLICLAVGVIGAVAFSGQSRSGPRVSEYTPSDSGGPASTLGRVRVRFDRPIVTATHAFSLTFTPAVTGRLTVEGDTLVFAPDRAFLPETQYRAQLEATAGAAANGPPAQPFAWTFVTAPRHVVYLAPDPNGQLQLFAVPMRPSAGVPRQLTTARFGVSDFSLSPDGRHVAYASGEADGAVNLWRIPTSGGVPQLLLACPQSICTNPAWSPDGARLAVSVRKGDAATPMMIAPPHLWVLDLTTGANDRLFPTEATHSFGARWSSDGQWISYNIPDEDRVGVYNVRDGTVARSPSTTRSGGVWRPGRAEFVMTRERPAEPIIEVHLYLVDPRRGDRLDLSAHDRPVRDDAPVWSPDGEWLAFRRGFPSELNLAPSSQLWRARADGTDQQPLTDEPAFDHDTPAWSPDGRYLTFVRARFAGDFASSAIWVRDMRTGDAWQLAAGVKPHWGP